MLTSRGIAAVFVALGLAACSSTADSDTGDQAATEAKAPKPAVIKVNVKSTVGILLDDAPDAEARGQALLAKKDDAGWIQRAERQLRLVENRLYYRGSYYPDGLADTPEDKARFEHPKRGQIPLPSPVDMAGNDRRADKITLGDAKIATIDGHKLVVREYSYEDFILTDEKSPSLAEPALNRVGGVWVEPTVVDGMDTPVDAYALPVDPDFLLQRTGYACMTEAEFPPNSIDSENAWRFYDFTCKADTDSGCHFAPDDPAGPGRQLPTESCVDALTRTSGIQKTNVRFERVDPTKLDLAKIRVGDPSKANGADMTVRQDALKQNRIVWRYISDNSCEMKEENNCVAPDADGVVRGGWHRFLEFDAVGQNVGSKPIHIGPINYEAKENKMSTLNDQHGVFQYSSCHHHYHFDQYGTFLLNDGAVSNRKNGFCLESTIRYSNNEYSPIATQYGRCTLQGVEVGWGDEYEGGIVCQWLDVTHQQPGQVNLGFHSNPGGFLCEGSLADKSGKPTFDDGHGKAVTDPNALPTPLSTIPESGWEPVLDKDGKPVMFQPKDIETGEAVGDPKPIEKPKCQLIKDWDKNNQAKVPVDVPATGGYVSRACASGEFGPLRDCGYKNALGNPKATAPKCTPGQTVNLKCSTSAKTAQVVRFCEASQDPDIAGVMDCMHVGPDVQGGALRLNPGTRGEGAPQSLTVQPGQTTDVTFTCPAARDHEEGGHYSIYTGAFDASEQAGGVTCN
jgi:Lysyl oxidase